MTVRDDAGVDVPRVTEWIVEHVPGVAAPLVFEFIAGGRSNLTYRVVDAAGRELVLRRPPLGNLLHTAHDMGREHRIIAALAPTDVPVAEALGHCDDPAVTGAPFYVMAFVPGVVLATIADAEAYPTASRGPVADDLVDVLCRLHAVDPDAVGLGTLARKEGYIERQLKRWHTQFEHSKTRAAARARRGPPPPRGAGAAAALDGHRPRRLPPREHDRRSRRRTACRARLGAGDARRHPCRRGMAGVVVAGTRRAHRRARSPRRPRHRGSRRGRTWRRAMPRRPGAISPTCPTTWRSAGGARRASARACWPAIAPPSWVRSTSTSSNRPRPWRSPPSPRATPSTD